MKKKKSFLLLISLLIIGLFNMPMLSALSNRVEIVTKAKQYVFRNTAGDSVGVLRQEIVDQDLVNGDIVVELTLNNAKNTEIIYVFNGTNTSTTINDFKTLTENVFTSYGTDYMKVGSILVNNTLVKKPLKNTISEVSAGLDEIASATVSSPTTLNSALVEAKSSFSTNAENKILVVVDPSNGMNSVTEDLTGITTVTFTNVADALEKVESTLLPAKNGTTIAMPFADYIINNFEVSLVGNPDNATLDDKDKTINWNLGDVKPNEVKKLRYKLELKSVVDESIIGLELLLNEAPVIIFNGITVANTDANQCSPVIKVLEEAVENPKTGIANYIIFGSTLLAIGGVTFIVARKKLLNRI